MSSPGIGTIQHIAGELFQMMTGTEMVHVPYRGAPPALMDLIGGRVQVMFDVAVSSIEYIKSGKRFSIHRICGQILEILHRSFQRCAVLEKGALRLGD
jgi:Tripartite tricarboxylate transporter family receptor